MKVRLSVPLIVVIDSAAWMIAVGVAAAAPGGVDQGVLAVALVAYGLFMGAYLWSVIEKRRRP